MRKLEQLQPYPFERLKQLLAQVTPNPKQTLINLSVGEPKHPTPHLITQALQNHFSELSKYPATVGIPELRQAIATWIKQRFYSVINPDTQILPVLGSREALFSFAQVVTDHFPEKNLVAFPNPFYQIYEGAALMGGATPYYLNINQETGLPDWRTFTPELAKRCSLLYVCSPNNPTGSVISLTEWEFLFKLSDAYGFVIAADECYSEIYLDESNPPLGALQAATQLGRTDYKNLITFSSLSKRSNAPGLRSGFVAGDAFWVKQFLLYRTYHGSAMSVMIQHASLAAWQDETHVQNNRALYRKKFEAVGHILQQAFSIQIPPAGFYFWLAIKQDDLKFAQTLYEQQHVIVLPGQYLGRNTALGNPGAQFVRIALVAPLADCIEAAQRIVNHAN